VYCGFCSKQQGKAGEYEDHLYGCQPGSMRKRPGWQTAAGDGRGLSVNTCDCNERLETVGTSEFE